MWVNSIIPVGENTNKGQEISVKIPEISKIGICGFEIS